MCVEGAGSRGGAAAYPKFTGTQLVDKEEKSNLANGQVLSRQGTPRLCQQRRFSVAEEHRPEGLEETRPS